MNGVQQPQTGGFGMQQVSFMSEVHSGILYRNA
jgi:hypothetical protein